MMDTTTEQGTATETNSITLSIIGVGFITIAGCIIFGNSLILISIRRFRRLQTLTNKFVFSLACADLSAGVSIIWQSMFNFRPEMELIGPLCLSRFVQIAPTYCSIIHLVIIAIDRYMAILQPLRYHEFITPKLANISIGIAWTLTAILTTIIIGTSRFIPGVTKCMMADVTPTVVHIVVFNVIFSICICIICYMYGSIFLVAKRQITQIQALEVTNKPGENNKGSNIGKELKAARQLSFIVLVFFTTHAIGVLVGILGYVYDDYMTAEKYLVYYKLSILSMFFNSFMNPIVYALKSKEFKEAFKRILCRRLTPEGQREDSLGFDDSCVGPTRRSNLTKVTQSIVTAIRLNNNMQTTTHA